MRGFVPTPPAIVDLMVAKLFASRPPLPSDSLLEPGCGDGAIIAGVIRWCDSRGLPLPKITGIELNPVLAATARARFAGRPEVRITISDFLSEAFPAATYIIGNPPYVSITHLVESEKVVYRREFSSARGRFDLYILFFERALRLLDSEGVMVFITPEKYLYVNTASGLRKLLASLRVAEVHLVPEDSFEGLVTYPTITTIQGGVGGLPTMCIKRDGSKTSFFFRASGESVQPQLFYLGKLSSSLTLGSVCSRISAGVATGADDVYVRRRADIPGDLERFAYPTISGRQLSDECVDIPLSDSILVPYRNSGALIEETRLGPLHTYLSEHQAALRARTCVVRKPWYAFHETPPLRDILRPKLLCKDVTASPYFWLDRLGTVLPRHSVYYIVPRDEGLLEPLCEYLNGVEAASWLNGHCQRAANGFIRLQSSILRRLPVPADIGERNGVRVDLLHEVKMPYGKAGLRARNLARIGETQR